MILFYCMEFYLVLCACEKSVMQMKLKKYINNYNSNMIKELPASYNILCFHAYHS